MIRADGASDPIAIGGLDWGYDLTGVMEGQTIQTISDPKGDGIIYSMHIYTWKDTMPAQWDEKSGKWGRTLPLLVGEFGAEPGERGGENPSIWVPKMLRCLQDHDLNWAAWCFHTGATPRHA